MRDETMMETIVDGFDRQVVVVVVYVGEQFINEPLRTLPALRQMAARLRYAAASSADNELQDGSGWPRWVVNGR